MSKKLDEKIEAVQEIKSKTKSVSKVGLLEPGQRAKAIEQLGMNGVLVEDNISDEKLLEQLMTVLGGVQEKLTKIEATDEAKRLHRFERSCENITDRDFVKRLFYVGVTETYGHLFNDKDKDLTDRQIWEKINKSGINPLSFQQIYVTKPR